MLKYKLYEQDEPLSSPWKQNLPMSLINEPSRSFSSSYIIPS
jgi:hypothetical protein